MRSSLILSFYAQIHSSVTLLNNRAKSLLDKVFSRVRKTEISHSLFRPFPETSPQRIRKEIIPEQDLEHEDRTRSISYPCPLSLFLIPVPYLNPMMFLFILLILSRLSTSRALNWRKSVLRFLYSFLSHYVGIHWF